MASGGEEVVEGKTPAVLPEPGVLAKAWEAEPILRQNVLDEKFPYMTRWVNEKAVGIPSVRAMALNFWALEVLARVWVPLQDSPKCVPVEYLRKEVGPSAFFLLCMCAFLFKSWFGLLLLFTVLH